MTTREQGRTLVMLALALTTGAYAQQKGTVRTNTLTQRTTPEIITPEPKVKADDDKTLTGETPLDTPKARDPKDVSAIASPVPASPRNASIAPQTGLSLQIKQPVSSATQHNGAMVEGVLQEPVRLSSGKTLPTGTAVQATILASAPAGKIQSAGILSLQIVRVGDITVSTNVLEFTGERGKAEVADAFPAKGTEAVIAPGSVLRFKVLGAGYALDATSGPKP